MKEMTYYSRYLNEIFIVVAIMLSVATFFGSYLVGSSILLKIVVGGNILVLLFCAFLKVSTWLMLPATILFVWSTLILRFKMVNASAVDAQVSIQRDAFDVLNTTSSSITAFITVLGLLYAAMQFIQQRKQDNDNREEQRKFDQRKQANLISSWSQRKSVPPIGEAAEWKMCISNKSEAPIYDVMVYEYVENVNPYDGTLEDGLMVHIVPVIPPSDYPYEQNTSTPRVEHEVMTGYVNKIIFRDTHGTYWTRDDRGYLKENKKLNEFSDEEVQSYIDRQDLMYNKGIIPIDEE